MRLFSRLATGLLILLLLFPVTATAAYPVSFQDAAGRRVAIDRPPRKVVSLVPSVTEILFCIGAGDAVCGVTYHDTYPPEAATKSVVGGFFAPSLEEIDALEADLIFITDLHQSVREYYAGRDQPQLIHLPLSSLKELNRSIGLLGRMFNRESAAEALISDIQTDLDHTAAKTAMIPPSKRKRAMRLMGRDKVMTPGDDSFQNEMLRLAGGIGPTLGKSGNIVPVTLAEWQSFNPQIIYSCGQDRTAAQKLLQRPGWRDVDAVKNSRILYYPCDLTCRLATRTGHFVSWLAAGLYADEFAELPPVQADGRILSHPVALELEAVEKAEVLYSSVNDYTQKTLLVHLKSPMAVVSTLEGYREKIRFVGNSYSPPQCWEFFHHIGLEASRNLLAQSIGRDYGDTSLLFTGADMDNLSIQRRQFKKMVVYALITAGVRSNALRMAMDAGAFYEPGTINILILTNMQLSPRAMQRAVISATEAKTAALWDMDIRSVYSGLTNPATGTGTDNIIVVQGSGESIAKAGGHTKMGELIAKAVYAGVQEAIFKQDGILPERHLFHRLKERKISLFGLVGDCTCGLKSGELTGELERLFLIPEYAGFVEAALALSDRHERGLITDLESFRIWCDQIAADIAGRPVNNQRIYEYDRPLPPVLKMAFDTLLDGAAARLAGEDVSH
jgi:ABC-type Fe3+-hydroxamate transport system substrate-binding protein/adenosylcobinamide amidohydrolase